MGCFDNIVSLREYCTPQSPTSDIYLNDIGLSKTAIEDIITGDYTTVQSLVDQMITTSIREVISSINIHFSSRIKTHSAIESGVIGVPDGSNDIIAGGGYRGLNCYLYNGNSYLNFELSSLSLHLDYSGSVDVLIYDLNQNVLLDTIPITAVAGQTVEIYPHKKYTSAYNRLNLWIGYDSDGIDSYSTLTRSSVCCGNYGRKSEYVQANGTSVTGDFISANQTNLTQTSGIGIKYSVWCDTEAWLCAYSRMLSTPIAHKVASEIYRRGLMVSPMTRTNNSTTTNSDLMTANFNWHETKYREAMSAILPSIHLPNDNACFVCQSYASNVIILP